MAPQFLARLLLCLSPAAATLCAAENGTAPPPLSFQIGRVTLFPFGFVETIGVTRSASTHDDVNTRLGSFPLSGTPSESLVSLRHTRTSVRGEIPLGPGKLEGYLEADFLNRPPQQPYRFRQYFGRYTVGDWEFSAGQEWSLFRPSRIGISTITSMMCTRVVDAAYHVGLVGYRDRQVRVVRRMGAWHAALTFENGRDFLPKIVHDSKRLHWELIGVAGRHGHHGGSVAVVAHANRRIDLVTQQSWVRGGPKDMLNTVAPGAKSVATIQGIEANVGKTIQLFAYGGLVYAARSAGNRNVREWTLGLTKTVGRDRLGPSVLTAQFSQLNRAVWDGPRGAMHFTMLSYRHYIGNPQ
jgi:hypothetical protein